MFSYVVMTVPIILLEGRLTNLIILVTKKLNSISYLKYVTSPNCYVAYMQSARILHSRLWAVECQPTQLHDKDTQKPNICSINIPTITPTSMIIVSLAIYIFYLIVLTSHSICNKFNLFFLCFFEVIDL